MKSKTPVEKGPLTLLIGTRKGAFFLKGDRGRRRWRLTEPILLGNIINHLVCDPRNGRTILMATRTGHLGPTVYRSTDRGKTWMEASKPPAFPKAAEDEKGLEVHHVFWLTPGHPTEPNVWYAGTSPQGLFRSDDAGNTWEGISGFNDNPMRGAWTLNESIPNGPLLHSIRIDPRDPNHMYFAMSLGGVFETTDKGKTWAPLNKGCAADFLPGPEPEYGQDVHNFQFHPLMPDRLYQQNHCGIYRMERQEGVWVRIGKNMPPKIGDIGFPIVLHPRDPDTAWVFPMDGTTVWPRTSPDGKPASYKSHNGGRTWKRLDQGLPRKQAWFTVKRQAMTADAHDPVGLYFGTTSGEIWASRNEGKSWRCLASHLPEIFSVETAKLR